MWKDGNTLERMRGEIPESASQTAMNSTIGVFPLPPHVKFPILITGTGNLNTKKTYFIGNEPFACPKCRKKENEKNPILKLTI